MVTFINESYRAEKKHQVVGNDLIYEMCACVLNHVQLFATLWTVAYQATLSMRFSRQEYWSGLLCPPPGDLSDPGIQPASLKIGRAHV